MTEDDKKLFGELKKAYILHGDSFPAHSSSDTYTLSYEKYMGDQETGKRGWYVGDKQMTTISLTLNGNYNKFTPYFYELLENQNAS